MVYLLVALAVVILDQLTKLFVLAHFDVGESVPVIQDIFHWTYILNPGAAFGMLEGSRWLFVVIAVAVMAGLDAVLGGIRASMASNYDTEVFISGFFINGILAAFLCYAGNMIGIDLYMVAILIFGMRIFQNIGVIRRLYMGK